jgi:L-serine/L-threonine ammonia-lyase
MFFFKSEFNLFHFNMHIRSPVIQSLPLSLLAKRPVLLKVDAIQPTGSFKIRGLGFHCRKLVRERNIQHFVNSSGGNAGLAVAYAAQKLKIKATIVVSESTPEFTRKRLVEQGRVFGEKESLVRVIVHGSEWKEADQLARKLAEEDDQAEYISPFDHPDIWKGNSTIVEELVDDPIFKNGEFEIPSNILLSVGGGGLLLGVLEGLKNSPWKNNRIQVIGCETEGAASFAAAFSAKKLVNIGKVNSIAGSLAAPQVSAACIPWILDSTNEKSSISVASQTVSDKQAVESCINFANDHRMLIEPACGAALAPIYNSLLTTTTTSPILIIICGGISIDLPLLSSLANQFKLDSTPIL